MGNPQTIDEAVSKVLTIINNKSLKEEDSSLFHHIAGRWIRNNWGLWNINDPLHKEFNAIGIFHADDMSGIILETAHRILNGFPINLVGQVNHYKAHWTKMGCDMKGNKI